MDNSINYLEKLLNQKTKELNHRSFAMSGHSIIQNDQQTLLKGYQYENISSLSPSKKFVKITQLNFLERHDKAHEKPQR